MTPAELRRLAIEVGRHYSETGEELIRKAANEIEYLRHRLEWCGAMNAKLLAGEKADDAGAADWIAARDALRRELEAARRCIEVMERYMARDWTPADALMSGDQMIEALEAYRKVTGREAT